MLGGVSYRIGEARRESRGAQPVFYTEPGTAFGGIPLVILAGDFLQLQAFATHGRVTRPCSLLREPWPDACAAHRH